MKILFLDDSLERHTTFDELFGDPTTDISFVETAEDAIEKLSYCDYDAIFLDHDLGGEYFVKSGDGTGYEVAEWICDNIQYKPIIIIHSMNPIGGANMHRKLHSHGFRSVLQPFSCLKGEY